MIKIDWIRHTSLVVTPDLCYGQTDIPVAPTFTEEAERVKEQLARRSYDAVFTSPLSRAKLLCDHCGYTDAIVEPKVMERNFGDWELRNWSEVVEMLEDPNVRALYEDASGSVRPPNGESVTDLLARVHLFIEEVRMERWQQIAVFCHGGVINSARIFKGEVEEEDIFAKVPDYGSITTLAYAHLEAKRVTQLQL